DLSVFELFAPLTTGGTVVLADDALALRAHPARDRVTLINTVPSAIAELLRLEAIPPSVLTINLAGEPLTAALARALHALPGLARIGRSRSAASASSSARSSRCCATIPRSGRRWWWPARPPARTRATAGWWPTWCRPASRRTRPRCAPDWAPSSPTTWSPAA